MKTLFFLVLFPALSFAQDLARTVKVADGSVAQCTSSEDAFTHKRGAYRVDVTAPVLKADWLIFQVKTQFLACVEKNGQWGFTPVSTFAPLSYKLMDDEITITTKDAFLTITRNDEIIAMQSWSTDSSMVAVGLEGVLTSDEKAQLEAGEEISVAVDFQLEKDLNFTSKTGFSSAERATFGSFRRHFKLKL